MCFLAASISPDVCLPDSRAGCSPPCCDLFMKVYNIMRATKLSLLGQFSGCLSPVSLRHYTVMSCALLLVQEACRSADRTLLIDFKQQTQQWRLQHSRCATQSRTVWHVLQRLPRACRRVPIVATSITPSWPGVLGLGRQPIGRLSDLCHTVSAAAACLLPVSTQAKDQAELNELVIWAAARGLLADVSGMAAQEGKHSACPQPPWPTSASTCRLA